MIAATIGLTLGVLTILFVRFSHFENWFYSLNLLALPLIYLGFAAYGGDSHAAVLEVLWGTPFFAGGILLFIFNPRWSTVLLGLFWLAHAAYDLTHNNLFNNSGVPGWYPALCAAFDGVLGVYLLILSSKLGLFIINRSDKCLSPR